MFLQNRKTIFEFLKHLFENSPVVGDKLVNIVDIDLFGNLIQIYSTHNLREILLIKYMILRYLILYQASINY